MSNDRWHCADCDREPDYTPWVAYRKTPLGDVRITLCNACWYDSPLSLQDEGRDREDADFEEWRDAS